MLKTEAKIYNKELITDEYGGSSNSLKLVKEIKGYFVPTVKEVIKQNSKININTTAQFISDQGINDMESVFEIKGEFYSILKKTDIYSKGCVIELICYE